MANGEADHTLTAGSYCAMCGVEAVSRTGLCCARYLEMAEKAQVDP
jgi:hypothetical protein